MTPSEPSLIKVIHLPHVVGGNPGGLSQGLSKMGVTSETLATQPHQFGYPADNFILSGGESFPTILIKKLSALRRVLRANVVFFNFGTTLFSPITAPSNPSRGKHLEVAFARVYNFFASVAQSFELALLRFTKKIIFIQYQGDDARQSDIFEECYGIDYSSLSGHTANKKYFNKTKRKQITRIAKYAHKVYALNPDLLKVLPRGSEFLPYAHIDLSTWQPVPARPEGPIVFGHAPSHQGIKGTSIILEALDELRQQGSDLDFVLIENLTNSEARKLYEQVDVMIDQLHIGWYGGLAVELMALAKPVACFIRDDDLANLPVEMKRKLPILRISKETLMEDLIRICELGRPALKSIGDASRKYVEEFHDQEQVALKILEDIKNVSSPRLSMND